MFESVGEVSHIPVNPILVSPITNERVEPLKQFPLYLVKTILNGLPWNMEFFRNGMGGKANSLLCRVMRDRNRCDAWREGFIVVVRSEEHTYELQYLMRISYAFICLKKKTNK